MDLRCSCDCGSGKATPSPPPGLRAEAKNFVHRHASMSVLCRQRRRENFLRRRAKRTEPAFLPIRAGVDFMFEQVSEKALCEILRIFHGVSAAAHETVKRRPINLAKLRERSLRNLRFGLAFPSRDNHAPVRRRKEIASAIPVPCLGLHVSPLYQNRRRQASPRKKLRFRAARAPESVCTRESIIMRNR
jgi:hypothetical protein